MTSEDIPADALAHARDLVAGGRVSLDEPDTFDAHGDEYVTAFEYLARERADALNPWDR